MNCEGKLSKSQIQKAYSVLAELQGFIKDKKPEQFLLDACNRFYTLIPHSFGVDNVPIIRDEETVKVSFPASIRKSKMLCEFRL